jgi:hypothetical protein
VTSNIAEIMERGKKTKQTMREIAYLFYSKYVLLRSEKERGLASRILKEGFINWRAKNNSLVSRCGPTTCSEQLNNCNYCSTEELNSARKARVESFFWRAWMQ